MPTPIAVVRSVSEKKDQDRVAAKKGAVIRSVPEAGEIVCLRVFFGLPFFLEGST